VRFRPCIDLHQGKVKQIVGATLRDEPGATPVTNFVAVEPPAYYAGLYRRDGLCGGHVIMLGPGNEEAAAAALAVYPGGLQVGGGITLDSASGWLARGAAKVIVTSFVFVDGCLNLGRLERLAAAVGPERLVLDLSCRRVGDAYVVAVQRWQTLTDVTLSAASFAQLGQYAGEFLIHAVDVEGQQAGIDSLLVSCLARWCPLPVTYAGGIASFADVERVETLGEGRVDITVGSALDIFGGRGLRYADLVAWNRMRNRDAAV
jgi:phosphoribosylformimino-5-aminoimidazole carboxamide ribotide isomerase